MLYRYAPHWFLDASLIVSIALLLRVRHKCPFRLYVFTSLLLLVVYFGLSLFVPNYTFHYIGPLNASGVETKVIVEAVGMIVSVCAVPPIKVWRFFQPLVAFFWANLFISRAHWVA